MVLSKKIKKEIIGLCDELCFIAILKDQCFAA